MPEKPRYLSKSRFRLALECPTKLFYTGKKEYESQNNTDEFLWELAKGGMQIGEYAKYFFADDVEGITVQTKPYEYEESLKQTRERMDKSNDVVIAEAAFLYDDCYIRADILKKQGDKLYLYEVKAKSWNSDTSFTIKNKNGRPNSKWHSYLYDVAFQKWVIEKATGMPVIPYLMLVDKDAVCDVGGLAQHFKIISNKDGRTSVVLTPGLTKNHLGQKLLTEINVEKECEWIYNNPVETDLTDTYSFEEFVTFAKSNYQNDSKIITPVGSKCKKCEFHSKDALSKLKSGLEECWVGNNHITKEQFTENLSLELWSAPLKKILKNHKFLLKDIERSDFDEEFVDGFDELTKSQRKAIQIEKVKNNDPTPHLEVEGLKRLFNGFTYPLHFIDFETSAMPLPWYAGLRPYEGIAFQFSHHIMLEDGRIEHYGQYLNFEPGVFPNFEFVRELKRQLEKDNGTIFRYHNHENTYLRLIARQLGQRNEEEAPDRDALIEFIDRITKYSIGKGRKEIDFLGERNMVDLHDIVLRYYYSPHTKGSNSLKQILPAVIHDFKILKEKYSKPIYGKGLQIPSLNYEKKVWITEETGFDPYKTLEQVFENYDREELDKLVENMDGLDNGGTAMMAYNMLQLSEIPVEQRTKIKEAMLRYCELDTLAMVMLYEGLKSQIA